jgi:hypothetical protein
VKTKTGGQDLQFVEEVMQVVQLDEQGSQIELRL